MITKDDLNNAYQRGYKQGHGELWNDFPNKSPLTEGKYVVTIVEEQDRGFVPIDDVMKVFAESSDIHEAERKILNDIPIVSMGYYTENKLDVAHWDGEDWRDNHGRKMKNVIAWSSPKPYGD